GLDLATFRPMARAIARERLGIPAAAKILLAVAHDLASEVKGGALLGEAARRLPRSVLWITMGRGHEGIAWGDSTVRPLGFIADDETKALAYNAADAIVHPALADNLPNVLVEAVA